MVSCLLRFQAIRDASVEHFNGGGQSRGQARCTIPPRTGRNRRPVRPCRLPTPDRSWIELMKVTLAYGKHGLTLEVPPSEPRVSILRSRAVPALPHPVRAVEDTLANPIGAAPLAE